jgi:methyltransferase (TIGR00027 family)
MSVDVTDTAAAIARVRAEEHDRPEAERLFDDPYAHLFAGGPAADEAMQLFLSAPIFRCHIRIRTRFIDDAVRAALAAGVRQIVNLGAGFDSRALRLAEIAAAEADVYEVDFATQLQRKREILGQAGIASPPFAHPVPADFTAEGFELALAAELRAAGFDRTRPAIVICDGVFGYLDDAACDRMLRWVAGIGSTTSRLVFNYPVSRFDPDELAPRVRMAGFVWIDDASLADVYGRYFSDDPPPHGDLYRLAVAWR